MSILITGTPGTGKTTLAKELSKALSIPHIEVSKYIKTHKFYQEYNADYDTLILDDENEDKLLDNLEQELKKPHVIDFHTSELFPKRWFDIVVVLRVKTDVLFDRLVQRGYEERKVQENVECEIMNVCLDEALECYDDVLVLDNNTEAEKRTNLQIIEERVRIIEELKK